MKNIAWIEKQIDAVSGFLAEDDAKASANPCDFAARLVAKNKRQHLDGLRHDLMLAQSARQKEIMELRLASQHMERGSIPLRFLAKISDPLHKFLASAAYHIRHGKDFGRGIPESWTNILDLRLAAIGYGSTRLFITGNITPDLAGDSALQDGLNEIFTLLNAGPEDLFESVHRIGPTAARGLADFLGEIEKEQTSSEFRWTSPDDRLMRWEGRLDDVSRLRSILESTSDNALVSKETITGVITLLSDTGRVEMTPDNEPTKIRITYPKNRHEWVAGFSLRQRVTVDVEKTSWFDQAAEKERHLFALDGPMRTYDART